MIPRTLTENLVAFAGKFPVVCLIGPRQSGKTTLARSAFPGYTYVSLEEHDKREFAIDDPRGFLQEHGLHVIIDEAQRAPRLFSYIQTAVDDRDEPGQYLLTGSQHFLMSEQISQSLAGRAAILNLLPLSLEELASVGKQEDDYVRHLFNGFYPRLYDKDLAPGEWYPFYIQAYVERDVRLIKNISDLHTFQRFLKLCAGRVGQVLNMSSLGNDLGVSHNTVRAWISILEASFIIFLLQPYYKNFNKRIIKSPKLYFYDTGLVCSLLGLETAEQLRTHYLRGHLFESFIISEIFKSVFNRVRSTNCYYWRDKPGHEIDCLLERGAGCRAVEIKSGATVVSDFFKNLKYWSKISGQPPDMNYIIYGGSDSQKRAYGNVVGWKDLLTVV